MTSPVSPVFTGSAVASGAPSPVADVPLGAQQLADRRAADRAALLRAPGGNGEDDATAEREGVEAAAVRCFSTGRTTGVDGDPK